MNILNILRQLPLTSFFVLAYAWTWLCWWSVFAVSSGHLALPVPSEWLATCGQFGPFVAAMIVTWGASGSEALGQLFARLFRWRIRPVWLGVSFLLLPATMLIAILLFAFVGGKVASLRFQDTWSTLPAHFVYLLILGGPLGEELGWSGFGLPRLQAQYGSVWASIWLGLLRAGWHLPLWWIYPAPCPYPLFVAGVILLQFLFTWLFNHTGRSVLYSLIFHTSLSIASVRLPDVPAYHIWVLCVLSIVVVILLCDRRLRLTPREYQAA
jgi:membrane protease YdiL (CAAX protease family)